MVPFTLISPLINLGNIASSMVTRVRDSHKDCTYWHIVYTLYRLHSLHIVLKSKAKRIIFWSKLIIFLRVKQRNVKLNRYNELPFLRHISPYIFPAYRLLTNATTPNKKGPNGAFFICSGCWIRTSDQVITVTPQFSLWTGLSHHPHTTDGGRSWGDYSFVTP